MKGLGRSVPSGQHTVGISQCADPDVAARIFEETEDIVGRQPVSYCVDGLRTRVAELRRTGWSGIAHQPLASRHPPLALAVLKRPLIPAPSPVFHPSWQREA